MTDKHNTATGWEFVDNTNEEHRYDCECECTSCTQITTERLTAVRRAWEIINNTPDAE